MENCSPNPFLFLMQYSESGKNTSLSVENIHAFLCGYAWHWLLAQLYVLESFLSSFIPLELLSLDSHQLRIGETLSAYPFVSSGSNSQIMGSSSAACLFWGPSLLIPFPPHQDLASCHAYLSFFKSTLSSP